MPVRRERRKIIEEYERFLRLKRECVKKGITIRQLIMWVKTLK